MQMKILGSTEFILPDDCDFNLPNFVSSLKDEEIKIAKLSQNNQSLIVAAGSDPVDGKITFLTADNRVMIFDADSFYIPRGPAFPSHNGSKIFLKNTEGRWPGNSPGFYVESTWIIQKSISALVDATIQTDSYGHENKHQSSSTDNT